jgi:hypothetical protein
MTPDARFRIRPFPSSVLATVRAERRDHVGAPAHPVIADGGEPLRCCLRDAVAGEKCLLFGFEPPLPGPVGPYRETGAVYIHAEDCAGAELRDGYPADWVGRPQVLRAYDARGWIHPATTTHDGTDPAAALEAVLSSPGVVEVHSRNIAYGCFMFAAVPA